MNYSDTEGSMAVAAPSVPRTVFEHWYPVLESYPRHGSASMFSSEFCCSLKAVAFRRDASPSRNSYRMSQKVSYVLKPIPD
jgi:hypothetical protein